MQVNVSTLLQEPIGSRRAVRLEREPFLFQGQDVAVDGEVELVRTDGSIFVNATLRLTITETCSNCLQPLPQSLRLALREEFWPEFDPLLQRRVKVPEGREGFPIVKGRLDLTEAVRQYVEMTRPMRPLCDGALREPRCARAFGRRRPAR